MLFNNLLALYPGLASADDIASCPSDTTPTEYGAYVNFYKYDYDSTQCNDSDFFTTGYKYLEEYPNKLISYTLNGYPFPLYEDNGPDTVITSGPYKGIFRNHFVADYRTFSQAPESGIYKFDMTSVYNQTADKYNVFQFGIGSSGACSGDISDYVVQRVSGTNTANTHITYSAYLEKDEYYPMRILYTKLSSKGMFTFLTYFNGATVGDVFPLNLFRELSTLSSDADSDYTPLSYVDPSTFIAVNCNDLDRTKIVPGYPKNYFLYDYDSEACFEPDFFTSGYRKLTNLITVVGTGVARLPDMYIKSADVGNVDATIGSGNLKGLTVYHYVMELEYIYFCIAPGIFEIGITKEMDPDMMDTAQIGIGTMGKCTGYAIGMEYYTLPRTTVTTQNGNQTKITALAYLDMASFYPVTILYTQRSMSTPGFGFYQTSNQIENGGASQYMYIPGAPPIDSEASSSSSSSTSAFTSTSTTTESTTELSTSTTDSESTAISSDQTTTSTESTPSNVESTSQPSSITFSSIPVSVNSTSTSVNTTSTVDSSSSETQTSELSNSSRISSLESTSTNSVSVEDTYTEPTETILLRMEAHRPAMEIILSIIRALHFLLSHIMVIQQQLTQLMELIATLLLHWYPCCGYILHW